MRLQTFFISILFFSQGVLAAEPQVINLPCSRYQYRIGNQGNYTYVEGSGHLKISYTKISKIVSVKLKGVNLKNSKNFIVETRMTNIDDFMILDPVTGDVDNLKIGNFFFEETFARSGYAEGDNTIQALRDRRQSVCNVQ